MKKLISYSLYGDNPAYLKGAIRNAETAHEFYPGWQPVFYCGDDVPKTVIKDLTVRGAVVLLPDLMNGLGAEWRSFRSGWRFLQLDQKEPFRVICRDADSRFSKRERAAVDAWEQSGLPWHVMRDHPAHHRPILAGMFGYSSRGTAPLGIELAFKRYLTIVIDSGKPLTEYGMDEDFLAWAFWPKIKDTCIQHDDFNHHHGSIGFPSPIVGGHFVGEKYDEHDKPHPQGRVTRGR